jgi:hypothetical protein
MLPPEISKHCPADVLVAHAVAAPGPVILPTMSKADVALLHRQLHEAVAAAIRICRIEADLSQDEVAYRLNWNSNHYVKRDSGRVSTSVAEFIVIAPVLKQTPQKMLARVLMWVLGAYVLSACCSKTPGKEAGICATSGFNAPRRDVNACQK